MLYGTSDADVTSQKHSRRLHTVDCIIQLRIEREDDLELPVWRWIKGLLEILGSDGMSSDETSVDNVETIYRVKVLAWRRKVEEFFEVVDRERVLDAALYPAQGAKPVRRVRHPDNPVTERPPVYGLPQSVYDQDWIEHQSENYLELTLHVSKEQFDWMNVQIHQG
jgi:hypothetical protein